MVLSVSVVYPHGHVASGLLPLTSTGQHHKRASHHTSLAGERSKFKIRRTFSTECVSLSHHHKIEKLLSRAIISQGSSVFHFFTLKSETSTKSTNPTNLYSAAVTCRTLYQRRASEWFSLIHRNLCPPRLCNLARRG